MTIDFTHLMDRVDVRIMERRGDARFAKQALAGGGVADRIRGEAPEEVRFDVVPLLVASDGALAVFGEDPCRLRPNLVIGGVAGLAEWCPQGSRMRPSRPHATPARVVHE